MIWLPPSPRPFNESTGYIGWYARTYLATQFDLIDLDGMDNPHWLYGKMANRVFRVIEEKPETDHQSLHPSQDRIYRSFLVPMIELAVREGIAHEDSGVFVAWKTSRLTELIEGGNPFPIMVTKIAKSGNDDQERMFDRDSFDEWFLRPLNMMDGTLADVLMTMRTQQAS
jgi:hypothetical protein